ncbi:MAG: type II TA system antitoxin MqsA family protein [Candidatus Ranarchaeia archaeon]|jgi:putative zinc finger/helix-turn-helix YgiT family protein
MSRNSNSKKSGSGTSECISCPECGSGNVKTSEEEYSFPYGVGEDSVNLTPRVPIRKCSDCGFSFLDNVGEGICHEAVCKHLGVMTPSQVKDLRKMYKLTQAEFAEITKLGPATLSRWERGILIQNEAYDNYLYLLGFEKNLKKIRERGESTELMEPVVERNERPQFRELDVNEELLNRKNSFILCAWD